MAVPIGRILQMDLLGEGGTDMNVRGLRVSSLNVDSSASDLSRLTIC